MHPLSQSKVPVIDLPNLEDLTPVSSEEGLFSLERAHKRYLQQSLTYTDDGRLLDEQGKAVMMEWEKPIMQQQARTVASTRGDILNVGFGMGYIDTFIHNKHAPRTHWIIECHPDVQRKMIQDGWLKLPHVRCIFAKWQDVIDYLPQFDGIYFDTWEESIFPFMEKLPNILRKDGVFSFFNNPTIEDLKNNQFIPTSYLEVLNKIGMEAFVESYDISQLVPDRESQGRVYWDPSHTKYYNPVCKFK